MIWLFPPAAALLGYMLGAVPVGVVVCRLYGVDVRSVGSGRTGTTNVWRAAGVKAAIPTLLGDALKGVAAIFLLRWLFFTLSPDPATMSVAQAVQRQTVLNLSEALAGGLAVIGHNWSIFLGFGGGAGGITAAATAMALSPLAGGVVWLVGAFLLWWTRMASIATFAVGVTAFATFLILGVNREAPWPFAIFGVLALFSVLSALQLNRERIREGEERIITLW